MFKKSSLYALITVLALAAMALSACTPATQAPHRRPHHRPHTGSDK